MLTTVGVKNLSLYMVLVRASPSGLDLFLMLKLPTLGGIHWDIAELAYMIRGVT